ncbi:hypothetical protein P3X46_020583 [Hevea brasiliensis]|uniref:RanBP2-type domain-containing protein n=1 Tax=Hevea brasiliensis TaxID=3981 RepID=A0ABQ9LMA8_HEVBR|nr:uncharacterized protein LOC110639455 [Hevea brasiliensis]KAJ9169121.1 hypothetical protein P3X46_020583 [Hevea brasiliensis]
MEVLLRKATLFPLAFPYLRFNRLALSELMSWTCKRCTFINSPSSKPTCQMCLSPASPPSSSSSSPASRQDTPKWSCKACTFLNPYKNITCEICGTRASLSSHSSLEVFNEVDLDEDLDSSIGSVFLPLRTCKRKIRDSVDADMDCTESGSFRGVRASNRAVDAKDGGARDCVKLGGFQGFGASNKSVTVAKEDTSSSATLSSFKILSYNVWFREELELNKRMKAIGDLIQLHSPDVICFQEVTPNIYDIFRQSSWWKAYRCSVANEVAYLRPYFCMLLSKLPVKSFSSRPFNNSVMGRELCIVELEVQPNKHLVVATSHLESPCPAPPTWDQMFSKERVDQAKEAINLLMKNANVIFGGDMNWDDKLDGHFPLPDGWIDAWAELRPGENGWTYDTKSNQMLSGNRTLQKRLDRFICNLHDFRISRIDMIGMEAIPGLSHIKEKKVRKEVKMLELPVFPSDHYGLLLTISGQ